MPTKHTNHTKARRADFSFPSEHLEAFDPSEFADVRCDEGGSETTGLRSDEEIQRADGRTCRLQGGTDVGIVHYRFEGEVRDPEEAQT